MGFKIEFRNGRGVMETHDLAPGIAVELLDDLKNRGARQITIIAPTKERWSNQGAMVRQETRRHFQSTSFGR